MAKRMGRPELPPEARRSETIKFTARKQLKEMLEVSAEKSGRTLSDEVQFRLDRSFDADTAMADPTVAALFYQIAGAVREAQIKAQKQGTYEAFVGEARAIATNVAGAVARALTNVMPNTLYVEIAFGTDRDSPDTKIRSFSGIDADPDGYKVNEVLGELAKIDSKITSRLSERNKRKGKTQ